MGTIIETNNLRAYYITKAYGVERTVKAVDDITLRIQEARSMASPANRAVASRLCCGSCWARISRR